MRKSFGVILIIITLLVFAGLGAWKILKTEKIIDDLYYVYGNSIYQINPVKLRFVKLYKDTESNIVLGKVLKVTNIPAVFFPNDAYPDERNVITAWVSKNDKTKVTLVEINSRLKLTKIYQVNLNLGPDLKLLDPVYALRTSRGGGGGEFGLGCEYGGNHDACVWVIPKVEPLKGPNDYEIKGIKVSYIDTIAYPVVERFYNKVEYKRMSKTLWTDQPIFTPTVQ